MDNKARRKVHIKCHALFSLQNNNNKKKQKQKKKKRNVVYYKFVWCFKDLLADTIWTGNNSNNNK